MFLKSGRKLAAFTQVFGQSRRQRFALGQAGRKGIVPVVVANDATLISANEDDRSVLFANAVCFPVTSSVPLVRECGHRSE